MLRPFTAWQESKIGGIGISFTTFFQVKIVNQKERVWDKSPTSNIKSEQN